jgi:hypothetical protein
MNPSVPPPKQQLNAYQPSPSPLPSAPAKQSAFASYEPSSIVASPSVPSKAESNPNQSKPSPYQYAPYQPPVSINAAARAENAPREQEAKLEASKSASSSEEKSEAASLEDKVLCLTLRLWWFVFLGLMTLLLCLIIGCLATPRWTYQGDGDYEITGGLLVCSNCPGDADGESYASIIKNDDFCDDDLLDGFCETITNLQGAGGVYLAFSLFTIVVLVVWAVFFILQVLKKKFPGPKWVPYLFPGLALVLNFLGIAAWGGASEAKFKDKDKCDVMSLADKEDICATDGPGLALFIFLFLILFSALFAVVYCLAGRKKQEEDPNSPGSSQSLNQAPKDGDRV